MCVGLFKRHERARAPKVLHTLDRTAPLDGPPRLEAAAAGSCTVGALSTMAGAECQHPKYIFLHLGTAAVPQV